MEAGVKRGREDEKAEISDMDVDGEEGADGEQLEKHPWRTPSIDANSPISALFGVTSCERAILERAQFVKLQDLLDLKTPYKLRSRLLGASNYKKASSLGLIVEKNRSFPIS
jgi:hypothetical protein